MVGAQGWSLTRVKNTFEREGVRTPGGSLRWETSIVRRIIQNDAYLSRTKEEVASLVDPAVAEKLDGERFGIYWYGQFQASRNYTGRKAFDVRPQDPKDWIAVPIPDAGIPPEWVRAARERIRANTRYQASTDPRLKLRGFIRCARALDDQLPEPGQSLLRVRRPPGTQQRLREHPLSPDGPHREATVERFVLGLLRDPQTFRERVEEQAEAMRRELGSGERVARALRKELNELVKREDNLVEAIGSLGLGTRLTQKFREELERIQEERGNALARLEEVSDVEEQARKSREIPRLVEEGVSARAAGPRRGHRNPDPRVRDPPRRADRREPARGLHAHARAYSLQGRGGARGGAAGHPGGEAGPVPGDLLGAGAHRGLPPGPEPGNPVGQRLF